MSRNIGERLVKVLNRRHENQVGPVGGSGPQRRRCTHIEGPYPCVVSTHVASGPFSLPERRNPEARQAVPFCVLYARAAKKCLSSVRLSSTDKAFRLRGNILRMRDYMVLLDSWR